MKKWLLASTILAGSAALTGCVTRGEDFSSDLSWIKPNVTTQKDIQALLGTPYKVGSASGTPTWTYGFYRFSLVGESHTKELKFYWNPEKKVVDYSFSSSFPADRNKELMSRPGLPSEN